MPSTIKQFLIKPQIILVPGWIHRSLLRNKLNTIDMVDYRKMRQVLSLHDMAEWFYMNDRFMVDNTRISSQFVDSVWHSFTPQDRVEHQSSVVPLSASEEIASSANQKLMANTVSDSFYQFVQTTDVLYVVLNEGFMVSLQDTEKKNQFVKDYLKECYAMAPVACVSSLGIFSLYMKTFAI